MATNSIGKLHAAVTADAGQFNQVLDAAAARTVKFGQQTTRAMDSVGNSTRRTGMLFMEASRGVEDFLISFSTGGIGGGLRGAANNISQFASLLNPMAGAFAGIGASIAAVTLPRLLDTSEATKDVGQNMTAATRAAEAFNQAVERQLKLRGQLAGIGNQQEAGAAQEELDRIDKEIADTEARIRANVSQMEANRLRRDEIVQQVGAENFRNATRPIGNFGTSAIDWGMRLQAIQFAAERMTGASPNRQIWEQWRGLLKRGDVSRLIREGVAAQDMMGALGQVIDNPKEPEKGLRYQLNALQMQRAAAARRLDELSQRDANKMFSELDATSLNDMLGAAKQRDMEQLKETRRRQSQLQDLETQLAIGERRRQLDAEQGPGKNEDKELFRLQLQKQDQQLQALRELINEVRNSGLVGVNSE